MQEHLLEVCVLDKETLSDTPIRDLCDANHPMKVVQVIQYGLSRLDNIHHHGRNKVLIGRDKLQVWLTGDGLERHSLALKAAEFNGNGKGTDQSIKGQLGSMLGMLPAFLPMISLIMVMPIRF